MEDGTDIDSPVIITDGVLRKKFGDRFLPWMQEALDEFVRENFET